MITKTNIKRIKTGAVASVVAAASVVGVALFAHADDPSATHTATFTAGMGYTLSADGASLAVSSGEGDPQYIVIHNENQEQRTDVVFNCTTDTECSVEVDGAYSLFFDPRNVGVQDDEGVIDNNNKYIADASFTVGRELPLYGPDGGVTGSAIVELVNSDDYVVESKLITNRATPGFNGLYIPADWDESAVKIVSNSETMKHFHIKNATGCDIVDATTCTPNEDFVANGRISLMLESTEYAIGSTGKVLVIAGIERRDYTAMYVGGEYGAVDLGEEDTEGLRMLQHADEATVTAFYGTRTMDLFMDKYSMIEDDAGNYVKSKITAVSGIENEPCGEGCFRISLPPIYKPDVSFKVFIDDEEKTVTVNRKAFDLESVAGGLKLNYYAAGNYIYTDATSLAGFAPTMQFVFYNGDKILGLEQHRIGDSVLLTDPSWSATWENDGWGKVSETYTFSEKYAEATKVAAFLTNGEITNNTVPAVAFGVDAGVVMEIK